MQLTTVLVAIAAAFPALSSALIYNKTQAYQPGNLDKYRCMGTEGFNALVPECLHQCQRDANANDGCAYDDLACHCANYDVYSPLVEQCVFPASLGGAGACTFPELGQIRPIVQDMCNFFNATGYTAYTRCGRPAGRGGRGGRGSGRWGGHGLTLSPEKTFEVITDQTITITDIDA
ncbi:hypothetical protein LTR56_012951 [Elasticomyces elasticus]|nr:hypothetical protein LTR56_012951 [Elasticomyces elasticus]KAK3667979.1 hypothetical protein LTR22_001046 [Elasticomyces elasticus]KAK4925080.1 hypothetical protein LTR49_007853 [Elasticomyces elasticus]KAK5713860.1 hypothetical protein LTR17_017435 [Elasticomyces elasticus]KAK5767619.1 hypothetical protein LTS12_002120 [Elasticomyces elasticus]